MKAPCRLPMRVLDWTTTASGGTLVGVFVQDEHPVGPSRSNAQVPVEIPQERAERNTPCRKMRVSDLCAPYPGSLLQVKKEHYDGTVTAGVSVIDQDLLSLFVIDDVVVTRQTYPPRVSRQPGFDYEVVLLQPEHESRCSAARVPLGLTVRQPVSVAREQHFQVGECHHVSLKQKCRAKHIFSTSQTRI